MYTHCGVDLTTADRLALLRLIAPLDISPGPGGSRMSDSLQTMALLAPHLGKIFPDRWTRAHVVALYPSSQIVAHRDAPIDGRRYHIPLDLNFGCWVFHGGYWQQLTEGAVYAMDPTLEHGAVNWGTTRRLHLLIDQI